MQYLATQRLFDELLADAGRVENVLNAASPDLFVDLEGFDTFRADSRPQHSTLWSLYAIQRLADVLVQPFQVGIHKRSDDSTNLRDAANWGPSVVVSMDQFLNFFCSYGCQVVTQAIYHPFFHEVIDTTEDETLGEQATIDRHCWPALFWGDLLIIRGGIILRIGPQSRFSGSRIATNPLYFSYCREYRDTRDLSQGWGHNSQWRTDGRRDYWLRDRYIYNADGRYNLSEDALDRDELGEELSTKAGLQSRIDLIRYRTVIFAEDDGERWPYDDRYDETRQR